MTEQATIFAVSSGPGRGGVAVVRVSGPKAGAALAALAGPGAQPRPNDAVALDRALVLWFPGPASFTGEDCAEFHVHGGRAVVAGVIAALGQLPGLRLAVAGEFTRRAFENGKLDLTAAEGLADLIDAETEAQRLQALRQMAGALGHAAEAWRGEMVRAMGLVEAAIDFSDEADVSERAVAQARGMIVALHQRLADALADGRRGEIMRDGFSVAIVGAPNAGKSSLINALSRRDVAIVSDEPGTTRDVVEARLDLGGIPVLFMDTAGLREAPGKVEQEGIRRSLARAADADLVLWVIDGLAPSEAIPAELTGFAGRVVRVVNKADAARLGLTDAIEVSAQTGAGVSELLDLIATRAGAVAKEAALITRVRHRTLIAEALAACGDFLAGHQEATEMRAEDLRRAAHALGQLTGRVDVEEVLGEIFGRFCIGK
jgi:tRNA modification GTPase